MTRRGWFALVFAMPLLARAAPQAPTGLMIDLLGMPERTVIENPRPRLTWIVNDSASDILQTAYAVRVAKTAEALDRPGDLVWDSGKVKSTDSVAVKFGGAPLEPGGYVWQVRTWNSSGGEPSGWSKPQAFKIGLKPKGVRETAARYPLVQTPVAPVAIEEIAPGHYFVDFGKVAFGALRLKADAAEAGRKITVSLGEVLAAPRTINAKPGGSIRFRNTEVALEAGPHEYTVPLDVKDARMMPKEIGPVMPFRYVEIDNWPGKLTAESAAQLATHYPFDEDAVKFECSDPAVNAIWELCRYSMKATSFCGVFVDGDRERKPYEADAILNGLGWWCCTREFTMPRHSSEYLIDHPTWPTEWPLYSVLVAAADYQYTGDPTSAEVFYNDLKAKSLIALEREDGLISTKPSVSKEVLRSIHEQRLEDIVDWPPGERDDYDMRPVNTVVNALHYSTLVALEGIAKGLGKSADVKDFHGRAARTAKAINEKLFDATTGLYVDGEGSTHSSLHANMYVFAQLLVPPDRQLKVKTFIRSKGMACSVYGAQALLEALYLGGQDAYALQLMTAPGDRSWSHMIRDLGTTITLEAWDNKYKANQDWNHAWGAAPANIIPRRLMGIVPLEPGYKVARIRPMLGGLPHASIDLPTVRGTIHLACDQSGRKFSADFNIPANTTAEVWIPGLQSNGPHVKVDGVEKVGREEWGAYVVIDNVGSGPHHFERVGAAE